MDKQGGPAVNDQILRHAVGTVAQGQIGVRREGPAQSRAENGQDGPFSLRIGGVEEGADIDSSPEGGEDFRTFCRAPPVVEGGDGGPGHGPRDVTGVVVGEIVFRNYGVAVPDFDAAGAVAGDGVPGNGRSGPFHENPLLQIVLNPVFHQQRLGAFRDDDRGGGAFSDRAARHPRLGETPGYPDRRAVFRQFTGFDLWRRGLKIQAHRGVPNPVVPKDNLPVLDVAEGDPFPGLARRRDIPGNHPLPIPGGDQPPRYGKTRSRRTDLRARLDSQGGFVFYQ